MICRLCEILLIPISLVESSDSIAAKYNDDAIASRRCTSLVTFISRQVLSRFEKGVPLFDFRLGLLNLYHVCCRGSLVDILQQFLDRIALPLNFSYNLLSSKPSILAARPERFCFTSPSGVFFTHPVSPYPEAFCCVKDLQENSQRSSHSDSRPNIPEIYAWWLISIAS